MIIYIRELGAACPHIETQMRDFIWIGKGRIALFRLMRRSRSRGIVRGRRWERWSLLRSIIKDWWPCVMILWRSILRSSERIMMIVSRLIWLGLTEEFLNGSLGGKTKWRLLSHEIEEGGLMLSRVVLRICFMGFLFRSIISIWCRIRSFKGSLSKMNWPALLTGFLL